MQINLQFNGGQNSWLSIHASAAALRFWNHEKTVMFCRRGASDPDAIAYNREIELLTLDGAVFSMMTIESPDVPITVYLRDSASGLDRLLPALSVHYEPSWPTLAFIDSQTHRLKEISCSPLPGRYMMDGVAYDTCLFMPGQLTAEAPLALLASGLLEDGSEQPRPRF